MHRENEYMDGDRLFVRKIRKCVCKEKRSGVYRLSCGIFERGTQEYDLSEDSSFVKRDNRVFWLSEEAKETVREAVALFERECAELLEGSHVSCRITSTGLMLHYVEKMFSRYDLLFIRKDPEGDDVCLKKNLSFEDVMRAIRWEDISHDEYKTDPVYLKICESKEDDLCENALYMAAVAAGDEKMEKRLKIYYNIATPAECSRLGKFLGVRILPKLPEEYDKNYVVDVDTIDGKILYDSGYVLLHRPYFAMRGSTHSKYQLNPHTRRGVDAAKVDDPSISFVEFLKLFEESEAEAMH